jgi:hypothetical protein
MQDESDHPSLRNRLLSLRAGLRLRLAEADTLDGGLLRVLADVKTVLSALDRDGVAVDVPRLSE